MKFSAPFEPSDIYFSNSYFTDQSSTTEEHYDYRNYAIPSWPVRDKETGSARSFGFPSETIQARGGLFLEELGSAVQKQYSAHVQANIICTIIIAVATVAYAFIAYRTACGY